MELKDYILIGLCIIIAVLIVITYVRLGKKNTSLTNEDKVITDYKIDELSKKLENQNKGLEEQKQLLNKQFGEQQLELIKQFKEISDELSKKINEFKEKMGSDFKENAEHTNEDIKKLIEGTAKLEVASNELKAFSTKIEDLEKILGDNKTKGAFGEFQLEQILANTFNEDKNLYDTQYQLPVKGGKTGDDKLIPDAVIKLPNNELICIDSKFPLEAYKEYCANTKEENVPEILKKFSKDVEERMKEVASKYVIQGTTADYAVMFVPSDGVVTLIYEKCPGLIDKARLNKVIIASPSTIVPLISSVRILKRDYERNKKADEVAKLIDSLAKDFRIFTTNFEKMVKQAETLKGTIDGSKPAVERINKKFGNVINSEIEEDEE